MKPLLFLLGITFFSSLTLIKYIDDESVRPGKANSDKPKSKALAKPEKEVYDTWLKSKAALARSFASQHHMNSTVCFLLDLQLPSGRKRFFVYDLLKDSISDAGLVAHGSCNNYYLEKARFSNTPGCGCSSNGKYKIGYGYQGRFSRSFKLFGLDSTNSNALPRNVVLHAYQCVPDQETDPDPICNSLGCPMVAPAFMHRLEPIIAQSRKPILLWILD